MMPVDTLDLDAARDFFGLRYFGALGAVRAALPYLRKDGSITLTTGIAKDRPGPGWAVAASICGAMEALTKALAVELAPVRVNVVSPGFVRSPLWSAMGEEERERMYARHRRLDPGGAGRRGRGHRPRLSVPDDGAVRHRNRPDRGRRQRARLTNVPV